MHKFAGVRRPKLRLVEGHVRASTTVQVPEKFKIKRKKAQTRVICVLGEGRRWLLSYTQEEQFVFGTSKTKRSTEVGRTMAMKMGMKELFHSVALSEKDSLGLDFPLPRMIFCSSFCCL